MNKAALSPDQVQHGVCGGDVRGGPRAVDLLCAVGDARLDGYHQNDAWEGVTQKQLSRH